MDSNRAIPPFAYTWTISLSEPLVLQKEASFKILFKTELRIKNIAKVTRKILEPIKIIIIPINKAPRKPSSDKVLSLNAKYKTKTKNSINIKVGEDKMAKKLDWRGEILSINPIMNKILTTGIEKLSDPLELVISATVAPNAVKSEKQIKYAVEN